MGGPPQQPDEAIGKPVDDAAGGEQHPDCPSTFAYALRSAPLSMICTLPLNGGAPIPCPSGTASSRSSQLGLLAGDLAAFGSLLAS